MSLVSIDFLKTKKNLEYNYAKELLYRVFPH
jgi:hypothetical protein